MIIGASLKGNTKMKALLIYPECTETFWSFKYALKFISRKAAYPPLGLLTVASMLPADWELQLVDMNVAELRDESLVWADIVCISAMSIQQKSTKEVISRCKMYDLKIIAGGPLFTVNASEFDSVDYMVLDEAEVTLREFLDDFTAGTPKHIYSTEIRANLAETPAPRWDLINVKNYSAMNIQLSRGCPYDCEFCNITSLFGRAPRMKTTAQMIMELDNIYQMGWRGGVFFVDDNFIGQKSRVKNEVLPTLMRWMEAHKYPFYFNTQISINVVDDPELMDLMSRAGFTAVFIGIETPNETSLNECNKIPNRNRDLLRNIHTIQQAGLQVQAGFIVGFDNDPLSIFEQLITFIQSSGIVTAMVGLLSALNGTRLYKRLETEERLVHNATGDNTDYTLNFVPKMNPETLLTGYQQIIESIYKPNNFYTRLKTFLREYHPRNKYKPPFNFEVVYTLLKTMISLGIIEKERTYYWRLFFWTLFHRIKLFPLAIIMSAYGYHFRKSFEQHLAVQTAK